MDCHVATLLAVTKEGSLRASDLSLRAQRGNPGPRGLPRRYAPRSDEENAAPRSDEEKRLRNEKKGAYEAPSRCKTVWVNSRNSWMCSVITDTRIGNSRLRYPEPDCQTRKSPWPAANVRKWQPQPGR